MGEFCALMGGFSVSMGEFKKQHYFRKWVKRNRFLIE
jgi:hypothetical protein